MSATKTKPLPPSRQRNTLLSGGTKPPRVTTNPNKPLTTKQSEFVRFWAMGETPKTACKKAGYSDDSIIPVLMRSPSVLAAFHREKKKYEEAAHITRKTVMDMHLEAYAMAKLMAEPSTMVAAARELGKMAGYYAPVETRVSVSVGGTLVLEQLNTLSDAELLKMIADGSAQALLPALNAPDQTPGA